MHKVRAKVASGAMVEYHYAWRGGPQIWRTGASYAIGSADYLDKLRDAQGPAQQASRGTFRAEVLRPYLASLEFRNLAPRTQRDYLIWTARVDEKFGDAPKASFERPAIRPIALEWRDQWSGKQAAYGWTVLRLIVGWAYDRGRLGEHHLRGGGKVYEADRADIVWTEPELLAFAKVAPLGLSIALRVAVETGLRSQDLVRLTREHILPTPGGRRIVIKTGKRGRMASIPVTQAMGAIIDGLGEGQGPLLRNASGRPWRERYLSQKMREYATRAKLRPELHLNDARGTACTKLLLAGASLREIATFMAWSLRHAAAVIEHYASLDPAAADTILGRLEAARVK